MWGALASQFIKSGGGKALLHAGLGALGGSRGQEPYAYQQAPMLTEQPYRQDYTKRQLDFLDGMASGDKPLMTQGQINSQLSGSRARLDSDFAAGAQRISERALGRQGRMGGMAEASLSELERARLGEGRQLEAGVQNTLASQAPGLRLNAAQAGLGFMSDEQQRAIAQHMAEQKSLAERAGFSKKDNIIGGLLTGFSKGGGEKWLEGLFNKGGDGGATGPGAGGVGPNSGPMVNFLPNGMADAPWMR